MPAYRDSGLRATVAINHQNLARIREATVPGGILPADIRAEMDAIRA